jgi:heme-degrading monooxygenase HmoA
MSRWHLAQVNVAYALADHDDPRMAGFMAQLDEINALAERSPGFVWRYETDSRDPRQRELSDARVLFNMSVWESAQALHAFTYRTQHGKVFAARRQWFDDWKARVPGVPELGPGAPFLALWWIAAGERPTPADGIARLRLLGEKGPHPQAFTFKRMFDADGRAIER